MSSSSQAAALAAFNGMSTKSKSELNHNKKKPPFVIPNTNASCSLPRTPMAGRLKRLSRIDTDSASISSQKLSSPVSSNTTTNKGKTTPTISQSSHSNVPTNDNQIGGQSNSKESNIDNSASAAAIAVTSSSKNNRPLSKIQSLRSPGANREGDSEGDYFMQKSLNNPTPLTAIKKSPSNNSNLSIHTNNNQNTKPPKDMISEVKNSIGSKMVKSDSLATHRASIQKVEELRNTINSKAVTGTPITNDNDKNSNTLSDFRDAVEMKRINSSGIYRTPSSVFEKPSNNSYSSLGSTLSNNDSQIIPQTPTIVIDSHDNIDCPIRIDSISPHGSNESLSNNNKKNGPKRKPPPPELSESHLSDMETGINANNSNAVIGEETGDRFARSSFESRNRSRDSDCIDGGSINSFYASGHDSSVVSSSKFPIFPSLTKKHHKKHSDHIPKLFKMKHKLKGVDTSVNLLSDESSDAVEDIIDTEQNSDQNNGPIRKPQTVQLKTTMRKTSKRKERKLTFNENKPWKNHTQLKYLTEQERKRYEGLWVSNKGLYLGKTATILTGVDYEKHNGEKPIDVKLVEADIKDKEALEALKAAQVSANYVKRPDPSNTHNLENAEINQLIHGIVVKRLWKRSKLSDEVLANIWNLVDFRRDGTLNKQEFLVGMWLVDQCLYGRKLPKSVDPEVWDSLANIGLNVVVKKKGRKS